MVDEVEQPMAPIGIEETVETIKRIARRLELDAQVAADEWGTEPDAARMREVKVLDGAGLTLEVLLTHWPDVRALLRKKRWAGRGN